MANAQLHRVLRHLHTLRDTHALAEASDAQLLERFTDRREEAAFTALLRRHGSMVLSVSRRVLPTVQDAEDVFQATFLLLARKANSIRKRESVGSWLHGVAHRLSLRMKAQGARRHVHEQRAADMRDTRTHSNPAWQEVQTALDAALGELPAKYRSALVLCHLEGKSHADAARQLGCPMTTLRTHLARGRKLLRARLANQGLTLSTAGLTALLLASAAPAAAPTVLAKATAKAALAFTAGQTPAALCSPSVAGLIEGGLQAMVFNKLKTAMAILLAVGVAAVCGLTVARGLAVASNAESQAAAAKEKDQPASVAKKTDDSDSRSYTGRILDSEGKPVAGAKVYLASPWQDRREISPAPLRATTGADGRFRFRAKPASPNLLGLLVATADGYGPAWTAADATEELTVTLAKDDVPIIGRVIDLQGRPVSGATIRMLHIQTSADSSARDDLTPFLEAVKKQKDSGRGLEHQFYSVWLRSREFPTFPQSVRTDADGRFRLPGIGRERMATSVIEGPTIVTQEVRVMTRAQAERKAPLELGGMIYYTAALTHAAAPTRPIIGVVRDKDTRKPVAGVRISSAVPTSSFGACLVQTTTDSEGRYRLLGAPKGNNTVHAYAVDLPYLNTSRPVPETRGLEPVSVDFDLKRGVWVEGRVLDKATGKPLPRAFVGYSAFEDNPHLRDVPGFASHPHGWDYDTAEDGSFRALALPGPGVVVVRWEKPTMPPTPAASSPPGAAVVRTAEPTHSYLTEPERDGGERADSLDTRPNPVTPSNHNLVSRINPQEGTESLKLDLLLDPGVTLKGTVLGPAGKPLAGATSWGLAPWTWWETPTSATATFTLRAFNPRRPRTVLFQHSAKKLAAVLEISKDTTAPLVVRLQPACTVTGRLVDAEGRPQRNTDLKVLCLLKSEDRWAQFNPYRFTTDGDGRFRVEGLIPGLKYMLLDGRHQELKHTAITAGTGEVQDLSDVLLKRGGE